MYRDMPLAFGCPFFRWEDVKGKEIPRLICDGAAITFKSASVRKGFVYTHCADATGWEKCPFAKILFEEWEE